MAVEEYHRVIASLRHAYGPAAAAERDGREKETFKVDERRGFLDLLRDRGATSLLGLDARVADFLGLGVPRLHSTRSMP